MFFLHNKTPPSASRGRRGFQHFMSALCDRADEIGVWLLRTFLEMIKKRHTYRNSEATTSILTITSNVVYGKYTGALPDGRPKDGWLRQLYSKKRG